MEPHNKVFTEHVMKFHFPWMRASPVDGWKVEAMLLKGHIEEYLKGKVGNIRGDTLSISVDHEYSYGNGAGTLTVSFTCPLKEIERYERDVSSWVEYYIEQPFEEDRKTFLQMLRIEAARKSSLEIKDF